MHITSNAIALDPEQLDIHGTEAHLRGSRCTVCSTYFFPRRWECAIDQSPCEDVALSDEGVLHVSTWVSKASYGKAELESDGFAVGQVDLPEGPRVQAVLVGDPKQWQPNQRMRLATENVSLNPDGLDVLAYRYEPLLHGDEETQLRVGMLASEAVHRWPDRVFTILHGHELTFGELARWVDAIAFDLFSKGVVAGDRVLVHLPNGHEVLVFQLGAWRIGAVAVPVVPIYRSHEIEFIVKTIKPRVVVTVPSLAGREPFAEFDEILTNFEMFETLKYLAGGSAPGWLAIPGTPSAAATPFNLPAAGMPDDCCLILFTSGTTSAPKGAMLTSRSLVQATSAWLRTGINESDVAFAAAPLAHIAGMIPGCLVPLTAGCRVVIVTRWNGDEAVELIDRHKATFSCGAAVFLQDLVDRYSVAPPDLHRLSYFVSGGAATPPDLIRNADALGVHAARAYGMTETAGVITIAGPTDDLERRAMFDGKLVEGIDVTVVDDAGAELATGEEGSIRIRGSQVAGNARVHRRGGDRRPAGGRMVRPRRCGARHCRWMAPDDRSHKGHHQSWRREILCQRH